MQSERARIFKAKVKKRLTQKLKRVKTLFIFAFLLLPFYLNGFRLRAAFRTEFCARSKFGLAVRTFRFFLSRTAFRTEPRAFAEFCAAFHARHFTDFHLRAAIAAEFYASRVLFAATRTRNSLRRRLSAWRLVHAAKGICHLSANGKAGT